jgi:hypothetical protein
MIGPGIGVGPGGVLDSVRYLADLGWLEIGKFDERTSIGLGAQARKLMEEATTAVT